MSKILKVVKKPVEAKAIQWEGLESLQDVIHFCESESMFKKWFHFEGEELYIDTLEGPIHTSIGSYIIWGNHGEFWSIKEEIFLNNYRIIPDYPIAENNFQDRIFEPR
ncbi:hypothetical protein [Listeria booriae]|uniref:hypothetical protein n=1 Tax=Listeria booriae TaxID=1552123 RepID=UPI0016269274|nr:hypothetical protein [Listeria booriae]MBC1228582.1 hypothetical protein [Listeria booriae]MBC1248089.1 hypothetical protein [Listeria booriae]MBC1287340.1 hypothetical protein [Listeria booriae]